jgi:hypothetical protein
MRRDEIRNNGQVIASFSIRRIHSMPEVDERQGTRGRERREGSGMPSHRRTEGSQRYCRDRGSSFSERGRRGEWRKRREGARVSSIKGSKALIVMEVWESSVYQLATCSPKRMNSRPKPSSLDLLSTLCISIRPSLLGSFRHLDSISE